MRPVVAAMKKETKKAQAFKTFLQKITEKDNTWTLKSFQSSFNNEILSNKINFTLILTFVSFILAIVVIFPSKKIVNLRLQVQKNEKIHQNSTINKYLNMSF